jgi:2-polyprenyl-3-methyl-5-hydroxy-6-metoxy-1,4-benzoquinol methylase
MQKHNWGELPHFYGPFHHYKEGLVIDCFKRHLGQARSLVLDAGCGSGTMTIKLAKMGLKVRAIDSSLKFVDFVKKRSGKLGLSKNITAVVGDILSQKSSKKFEAIYCGDVLEHLEDDQAVVKNFYRLLKKGGICVVSVPAQKSWWSRVDEWSGHKRRYEEKELEDIFLKAGFKIKESFYYGAVVSRIWMRWFYPRLLSGQPGRGVVFEDLPKLWEDRPRLLSLMALPFKFDDFFRNKKGIGMVLVGEKQ